MKDVERFRVPLEPGERCLLDFLICYLDDKYEIYVQPFLNGDRPDIVIVRPDAGVMVVEVKDWRLKHYQNHRGGSKPWLLRKNGASILSPLAQVEKYKSNLYNLHLSDLFEHNLKNGNYFSVVQPAVYFHNESTSDAKEFCYNKSRYTQVFGCDALNSDSFYQILSKARLNHESDLALFDKSLYKSFKRFLHPPEHTPEMGKNIRYTTRQQELVESREKPRQKIRGVAGCGKTKVLAGRAVSSYARTNDRVLILTYNITLRNYIHDRINEVRAPFPWSAFEIAHYHHFFKTQTVNYGLECLDLIQAADQKDFFAPVKESIYKYRTILVDEVQDYKQEWLRLLIEYFLAKDGEFVVFGDEKQNIYSRTMGSDRFPIIPTVPGRWNELKESFRMQTETLRIAQAFQDRYFRNRYEIDKDVAVVQGDVFSTPTIFKYYSASEEDVFDIIRNEIISASIHPNDLVVLAPTHETIRDLEYKFRCIAHERTTYMGETKEEYESLLRKYGIEDASKANNNRKFKLELDSIQRIRKFHFWPHAGTVKLSTIHSFKGWEAHTLVLVICNTHTAEDGSLDELIYTALTRARKNLIIIDETSSYRDFFKQAFNSV